MTTATELAEALLDRVRSNTAMLPGAAEKWAFLIQQAFDEQVKAERTRLLKWVQEQARSHHKIAVEAYDRKDEWAGDIHNSLSSGYTRLQDELLDSQERSPK